MDSIVYIVDNGQKVQAKLIRRFSLGSKIYAEIQVVDEDRTRNVLNSDLLVKDEFYQRKNEESEFSTIVQTDDMFKSEVKDANFVSTITIGGNGITSAKIERTTTDETSDETEIESVTTAEPKQIIVATSTKNGNVFKLGDITKLASNSDVKKFKLDPEAIKRVLDGKQKQHKGFTFRIK